MYVLELRNARRVNGRNLYGRALTYVEYDNGFIIFGERTGSEFPHAFVKHRETLYDGEVELEPFGGIGTDVRASPHLRVTLRYNPFPLANSYHRNQHHRANL